VESDEEESSTNQNVPTDITNQDMRAPAPEVIGRKRRQFICQK
jgi:hypothetical protein